MPTAASMCGTWLAGCLICNAVSAQAALPVPTEAAPQGQRFGGLLTYSPPCSGETIEPFFGGRVTDGRIVGRAARGTPFDWTLSPDGRFAGEMELRPHRLGPKMQIYRGRVHEGAVEVDVTFVVPGHRETECKASSRLPLQPIEP